MANRRGEPVKHTCPDIDRIMSTISDMYKEMKYAMKVTDNDELSSDLDKWMSQLYDIGIGGNCELENLRKSNAALRDWGNEMLNELEYMDNIEIELEGGIEDLKDRVLQLETRVCELEGILEDA